MASIVKSLEEMYGNNSRNEMNQAIFDSVMETCTSRGLVVFVPWHAKVLGQIVLLCT